jgi:hypothetical protein
MTKTNIKKKARMYEKIHMEVKTIIYDIIISILNEYLALTLIFDKY